MNISLTENAMKFFKDEMGLGEGQGVRFTSKVYGKTEVHEGLSVALRVETPNDNVLGLTTVDGIQFFTDKNDDWFFNGYDLEVDYDNEKGEPLYHFVPQKED
ncbi:MAG: iron-sulfur cluster biosynthesis protein [Aerococcus sp.]|nr:iron-sulfur cluster biosynthesis protein [Aerococcus sp.]